MWYYCTDGLSKYLIITHTTKMSDYTPLEKAVSPSSAIDATGLRSPVPLLRIKKELAVVKAGEIVQLDSDDPNTGSDSGLHFRIPVI